MRKLKGFSLLEIVIVMGIMAILAALVLPTSLRDLRSEEVKTAANDIAAQIRIQQNAAFVSKNNSSYGIKFTQKIYTTFTGNSFGSGLNLENNTLASNIVSTTSLTGGSSEIVFPNGTFKPSSTGNIDITNGYQSYRVNINQEGLVTVSRL